jgi:hypothetical protein
VHIQGRERYRKAGNNKKERKGKHRNGRWREEGNRGRIERIKNARREESEYFTDFYFLNLIAMRHTRS